MCRCDTRATRGSRRESYPRSTRAGRVSREGGSRQDSRQPRTRRKTVTPSRATPPDQVTQKPFGATHRAMLAIAQCPGTVTVLQA